MNRLFPAMTVDRPRDQDEAEARDILLEALGDPTGP
jgi:hypothetical protein